MADISTEDVFQGKAPITKLVEELNDVFPNHSPIPTDPIEVIMFRAGQRSVVEYIQDKLED